jgi:hypothetical protein
MRKIHLAYVPGVATPLLDQAIGDLLRQFGVMGHVVQATPDNHTDVIFTSAPFGQSLNWRHAMMFTARHRFKLDHTPAFITFIHVRPSELSALLAQFGEVLAKTPPDPEDYEFPGLAPTAYRVLYEQGHRGGPILSVERLLQAQAKSIRIVLMVGEDRPELAYHFDLVGAFPVSRANGDLTSFYEDIALRIATSMSATDINRHQTVEETIARSLWDSLSTPKAMCQAGYELGVREFFTDTVHIADLVPVPAVAGAVASQYSEGCYGTWDPAINALVATVTGSARPVDKKAITEDELAVIAGVREDYMGALVRPVEGKRNDPPSSEAVEMFDMDSRLPSLRLGPEWSVQDAVPVIRSKLHGHRGVKAFDPQLVEYVPLDEPYLHYFVTCGTDAQARGVRDAFGRSVAMQTPEDPRQLAFTVLPGHGIVVGEKWIAGKQPFQAMWEAMDAGQLVIDSRVPQGLFSYLPGNGGQMVIVEED